MCNVLMDRPIRDSDMYVIPIPPYLYKFEESTKTLASILEKEQDRDNVIKCLDENDWIIIETDKIVDIPYEGIEKFLDL